MLFDSAPSADGWLGLGGRLQGGLQIATAGTGLTLLVEEKVEGEEKPVNNKSSRFI
jgi:hypothetical protein